MTSLLESTNAPHSAPGGLLHDLQHFLGKLRRGWRVMAVAVVGAVSLALAYLFTATPLYEATAQLLILQQGGRPLSVVANADPSRPLESSDDYIPSHMAILRSHAVVKQAIGAVGINNLPTLLAAQERDHDPVQEAIDRYLKVSRPERLAKSVRIDCRARSSDEALRMVAAIAVTYRKFLDENFPRGTEVIALMDRARHDLGVDVEKAEKEYTQFLRSHPLLATDEKGRSLMTTRLERWDRAVNEAQVRETLLKGQLDLARKLSQDGAGLWVIAHAMSQLSGDSSNSGLLNFTTNTAQVTSWDYIRQLSVEQQQLAEKYGPQYSKVQDLQERITRIQERVRASRSRYEGAEIKDLVAALEQSGNTNKAICADLVKRFEQDRTAESDCLIEITLRGNLERRRALFNAALDQFKQVKLSSDFSPVSAHTLQDATPRPDPVRPCWALTLALAVLAGLASGIGLVIVRNRQNRVLESIEDVREALNMPVLVQVPQMSPKQEAEVGAPGLVSHTLPHSSLSEAYKVLRTHLALRQRQGPVQVVMVTSAHSNEGKTTTASNLAISLARAGQRVVLVDADLRRPSLDHLYNLPGDRGLSDVLQGTRAAAQVVQRSSVDNLDVMTAGPLVSNPAELLMSPRLKDFFTEMRSAYEAVVVDSSPLLDVTDPCLLVALGDATLLVVREGVSQWTDAEAAVEVLRTSETTLLGVLLNGTAQPPRYYCGSGSNGNGAAQPTRAAAEGRTANGVHH